MANLGPEVSGIFSCKDRGEYAEAKRTLARAQGIIAEIRSFPEMQTRLPEIEMLEEVISELLIENPKYQVSRENLESYFLPFALRLLAQK